MKLNKRVMALLLVLGLAMTATVGVTVAYLIDATSSMTNTFAPSEVSCEVKETEKGYSIKNTGDVDAYIRATVVVTWKKAVTDENGNITGYTVYATAPTDGGDYSIEYSTDAVWVKGSDGYYYYTSPVAPEGSTSILINSFSSRDNENVPDGYNLSVEIIASAIQATSDAVEDWSNAVATIADDRTLTVKSTQ